MLKKIKMVAAKILGACLLFPLLVVGVAAGELPEVAHGVLLR